MKISVLGYPWEVLVLPKKELRKRFGKCSAIMVPTERRIYLRKDRVDYLHIAHELTHAAVYYLCKAEIQYTDESWEEMMADFVGIHGQMIHETTTKILKKLS